MRAVGFDLDDTLAVTDRDRTTLLAAACERVGVPGLAREDYLAAHDADLATETREPIFAELLAELDTDVAAVDLADAYRAVVEEALAPVDGAADLVGTLRADYRVGLLTDGPLRAQQGKLARLGWTDLFDAVVISGGLPAGKPDRRAFEALLSDLDVAADETVYVGDHPENDVAGAARAGLWTVQVRYDGGPDRHPAADATVRRERLAATLPAIIRDLPTTRE